VPIPPITGLVAATYTPFDAAGRLDLDAVPPLVEHLLADGVAGLFVCGSTGEGMSLTSRERQDVTAAFVVAAAGRVPVVAHVGHNSLADARDLAAHAAEIGIDAISATTPSYFKPGDVGLLVDCVAEIAGAAPDVPFYYYHIPVLTGVDFDMVTLLERAAERVPNLAGLKYTCPRLHEFQACGALDGGRFDVLWGTDEMLLGGLATGARGAVGSTFNVAAPLYNRLIAAFDAGDLDTARALQLHAVTMIRTVARYPFHPAMKHVLRFLGVETGACRLPLPDLTERQVRSLRDDLEEVGYFEWGRGR
jgi:N-acetylneuraminate lyase